MKLGLVGAANVGKSTLFNRLIGTYRAIVTNIAGTTRELLRDRSTWEELKNVEIIDSPGLLDFHEELPFIEQIIAESDILLFVVDATSGITAKEEHIAAMIIASGKKDRTIMVVNKLEGKLIEKKYMLALAEYYVLGFESVVGVSAKEGENIDVILEMIASLRKKIGDVSKSEKDVVAIPIAIAGKPNAGKSTLMNTIANQIVSHVSEKPGTTLDYLVTDVLLGKQLYRLYDTAGIRKHARASELEKIAWDKTYRMIDYIKPIVVVMIDMTESMSHMDLKIIGEMIEHKVPLVVVLSKVDLVTPKEQKQKMDIIIKYMEMAKWVPIVPLSSKTNIGISQLFGCIKKIFEQQNRRISTSALNKALGEAMIKSPPRFPKNKICKLYYMTQVDSNPPTFCCFINKLEKQNFAFSRWIDNTLRKNFGFIGVPISLTFKEKGESDYE